MRKIINIRINDEIFKFYKTSINFNVNGNFESGVLAENVNYNENIHLLMNNYLKFNENGNIISIDGLFSLNFDFIKKNNNENGTVFLNKIEFFDDKKIKLLVPAEDIYINSFPIKMGTKVFYNIFNYLSYFVISKDYYYKYKFNNKIYTFLLKDGDEIFLDDYGNIINRINYINISEFLNNNIDNNRIINIENDNNIKEVKCF